MATILSIRTLFLVVFFFCLKETYSRRIKRIVRGTPVTCGDQPRVSSLRNSTSDQHICGATIITPDHALTAAHCVQHPAHQYYLQLNNYCAEDDSYPRAEVLDVIPHEEYDKFTRAHDLAVLLITLDLDDEAFSSSVLPTSSFGLTSECKIYGYGTTDPSAPTAFTDTLLVGKVETVSLDDCIRQLGPFVAPDYDHGMMCALGEGADACQGDSGGPLICANSLLQGLSSYGLSCGVQGQPGVYTSIGAHLSWINDVINRRSHE